MKHTGNLSIIINLITLARRKRPPLQDPPDEEELEGVDRGEGEDEGAGAGGGRGVRLPVRRNFSDALRRTF